MSRAKQDGRKLDHKTLESMRSNAVRRVVEDGEAPSAVMRSMGLCRTSIYPWLRAHARSGAAALAMKTSSGPAGKLDPEQKAAVRSWIVGKNPRLHGFACGQWTRRIVATLIAQRFGIALGLTAVGRLLVSLDITPPRARHRAV